MKKILGLLLLILLLSFGSVKACSLIYLEPITVLFADCDSHYDIDIMVSNTEFDFPAEDMIHQSYKDAYPNYESSEYLVDGNWVSYRAYFPQATLQSEEGCYKSIPNFEELPFHEYKIVILDKNGTMVFTSNVREIEELEYDRFREEFKVYEYNDSNNTFEIVNIKNGCADLRNPMNLFFYFWLAIIFGLVTSLSLVYLSRIIHTYKYKGKVITGLAVVNFVFSIGIIYTAMVFVIRLPFLSVMALSIVVVDIALMYFFKKINSSRELKLFVVAYLAVKVLILLATFIINYTLL